MVPKVYVSLDQMPLNQNGKVDIKALPVPTQDAYNRQEYVAPQSETEKKLVEIWETVLGIDKIGIQDDFFELGGHSLNAIKIILLIKKELDFKVNMRNIFDSTTIVDLALDIDFSKKQEEIKSKGKIVKQIM